MCITLRLYGNLRRYAPDKRDRSEFTLDTGMTIRSVLESLGVPENSWWMAAVTDQVVEPDTELHEGDLLEVFDPVGGGGGSSTESE